MFNCTINNNNILQQNELQHFTTNESQYFVKQSQWIIIFYNVNYYVLQPMNHNNLPNNPTV